MEVVQHKFPTRTEVNSIGVEGPNGKTKRSTLSRVSPQFLAKKNTIEMTRMIVGGDGWTIFKTING